MTPARLLLLIVELLLTRSEFIESLEVRLDKLKYKEIRLPQIECQPSFQ